MPASLTSLVRYSDKLLKHAESGDYPGAKNGLQLANSGRVTRIAAAVDANLPSVAAAITAGADLLVVHHGIGWNDLCPVTGGRHELLRKAMNAGLAIYSSHLPLDAHPTLGNNTLLMRALGVRSSRPFMEEKGQKIGRRARVSMPLAELSKRLAKATGSKPHLIPGGDRQVRHLGVITGGGGSVVYRAAEQGIDTLVTGEANHWVFSAAHELGMNVLLGGHYLTETFGVRALAEHLGKRYRLPWSFLDLPSGL